MKKSQRDLILNYLQNVGTITPIEALHGFGCFRLSERIREIEALGYQVEHIPFKTPTGKRVMSYRLKPKADLFEMMGLPPVSMKFLDTRP